MKTVLITTAAALLAAGPALAGEVQVIHDPTSTARITVIEVPYESLVGHGAAYVGDDRGILTQDVVDGTAVAIPGFDPDVVINIWTDDTGGVRFEQVPPR